MTAQTENLDDAYRRTRYDVVLPSGRHSIRIGAGGWVLAPVLAPLRARRGAFITAWNPGSRPLPVAANEAANRRLAAVLTARLLAFLPHEGVGDDGWMERGWFVLDIEEEPALEIARRFGQRAIVTVESDGAARLLYTGIEAPPLAAP